MFVEVICLSTQPYDVVIVGGGAAGLSAALVLGRARRRVAVIDSGAPRNAPSAHMHGFLSRDGLPPAELLSLGRTEVARYGVELIDDEVLWVEPGFSVCLSSGRVLEARRILIATGASDKLPDLPGAPERWGRDLLHCPYCHGWEVRDQPLGALGGHPGSVQHALLLRQWSDDIVFFSNGQELTATEQARLKARGVQIVTGQLRRLLVEGDRLTGIELGTGQVIPLAAVFIRPNNRPQLNALGGLRCDVDRAGFLIVDADGRTSTAGVWAAGNVVDARACVIIAAGAGASAAMAINADLVQEEVERACDGERSPV